MPPLDPATRPFLMGAESGSYFVRFRAGLLLVIYLGFHFKAIGVFFALRVMFRRMIPPRFHFKAIGVLFALRVMFRRVIPPRFHFKAIGVLFAVMVSFFLVIYLFSRLKPVSVVLDILVVSVGFGGFPFNLN